MSLMVCSARKDRGLLIIHPGGTSPEEYRKEADRVRAPLYSLSRRAALGDPAPT